MPNLTHRVKSIQPEANRWGESRGGRFVNQPNQNQEPTGYRLTWRRPPFATLCLFLIPFGYSGYGGEGLRATLVLIAAFFLGFSPTLWFVHCGKNRFVKHVITAFVFLPWMLIAQLPKIPSDNSSTPAPPLLWQFGTMFFFAFIPGLVLGVVSFGLYCFWRAGFDPITKKTPNAARQAPKA